MSAALHAALEYAAGGWPVLPCLPDGKAPVGPLVPHGCKDATTDPGTITGWWERLPAANVAVATGRPGPDVVDVDVKAGAAGMATLGRLQRAGRLHGAARLVRTPSGGWHLYFAGTGQGNGSLPRHGIDFRAAGGYVLAPPSAAGGRAYELVDARESTATVDFAAIRRLLDPPPAIPGPRPRRRGRSWSGLVAWLGRQPPGGRNNALYWAACVTLTEGAPDAVLEDLAGAAITVGLDAREAVRTIGSARRRAGALP